MVYYTEVEAAPPAPVKSALTLDYIRSKANEKYSPYALEIGGEILTLVNPMQLSRERRGKVRELLDEMSGIQDEVEAIESRNEAAKGRDAAAELEDVPDGIEERLHNLMVSVVAASADNQALAKVLCDELIENYGMTHVLFSDWMGADEVGEASGSSSSSTSTETT